MRVSLLPRLIATFAAQHGGVKLREKRSEASGHLLSSLLNYLSSWRGMKTDRAGLPSREDPRAGREECKRDGEDEEDGVETVNCSTAR